VTREALKTQADCYIMGEASCAPSPADYPAVIETGHTNSEWIGARLIRTLLEPHGIDVDVARIPSIASMAKSTRSTHERHRILVPSFVRSWRNVMGHV